MKLSQSVLQTITKLALGFPGLTKPVLRTGLRLAGRPRTGLFMNYVVDFETAFESDDWSPIKPYFADDAVYEVKHTPFDCRLVGPDSIVEGFQRCLDSLDRQLDRRLWIVEGPHELDDLVTFLWRGKYGREGCPPLRLEARQTARYRDRQIVELVDAYSPGVDATITEWLERYGRDLSPSYV